MPLLVLMEPAVLVSAQKSRAGRLESALGKLAIKEPVLVSLVRNVVLLTDVELAGDLERSQIFASWEVLTSIRLIFVIFSSGGPAWCGYVDPGTS